MQFEPKFVKFKIMKTLISKITGVLVVAMLVGFATNANSQDPRKDKKSRKEERKNEMERTFQKQDSLLTVGQYVLEANYLQNKYGSMVTVSSNLNFIMVNGLKGVLQTGTDLRQGYNGVGGITAEGTIEAYKMQKNPKNFSHTVTFNLMTNLGTFDILLNVYGDGNAQATISGSTSGRLTWKGQFVALSKSKVYKGQQTY